MDGTENTPGGDRSPAINRRRLLKGAAAAGVGVAAWSAPNVQSFGFAPAYGASHTGILEVFEEGEFKINAIGESTCASETSGGQGAKWGQASKAETASSSVPGINGNWKAEMDDSALAFPGLDGDLCIGDGDAITPPSHSGRGFNPTVLQQGDDGNDYWCFVTGYHISCGAGGSGGVSIDSDLPPNCVNGVGGIVDEGILIQGCPDAADTNSFVFFQMKCFPTPPC